MWCTKELFNSNMPNTGVPTNRVLCWIWIAFRMTISSSTVDAAVAVDEALSARRPAGKKAVSADDCEEAKAKPSKKQKIRSLAGWDELSEAKQISLD